MTITPPANDNFDHRADRAARRYRHNCPAADGESVRHLHAAQLEQAAVDLATTAVTDRHGVAVALRPAYLTFGRSVWALLGRRAKRPALPAETARLVSRWAARGLNLRLLVTIAAAQLRLFLNADSGPT